MYIVQYIYTYIVQFFALFLSLTVSLFLQLKQKFEVATYFTICKEINVYY